MFKNFKKSFKEICGANLLGPEDLKSGSSHDEWEETTYRLYTQAEVDKLVSDAQRNGRRQGAATAAKIIAAVELLISAAKDARN